MLQVPVHEQSIPSHCFGAGYGISILITKAIRKGSDETLHSNSYQKPSCSHKMLKIHKIYANATAYS